MEPPPATYAVGDTVPPILGKPTTSMQAIQPPHSHQLTGHATQHEETNHCQTSLPDSLTTQTNTPHH
jgi:hypothetical protein